MVTELPAINWESSTKFYEADYRKDSQGIVDDEDDTQKCDEEIMDDNKD